MSAVNPLFKEALLDHYRAPRNQVKEPMDDSFRTARGRNPRCGDDIELGLRVEGDRVVTQFRGRGCSICIASSSMLTEAINDRSLADVESVNAVMKGWAEDSERNLPETLEPLSAVATAPARKKCALLAWNALDELLSQVSDHATTS